MNYLAHMALSGRNTAVIAGNFAADYLRLSEIKALHHALQHGVDLHRTIDTFTDNHPAVRDSIRLARPMLHKYAPVAIDILYDLLLSETWHRWFNESLEQFEIRIYEALLEWKDHFPTHLKERTQQMVDDHWLLNYHTRAGIEEVFKRTAFRARFSSQLEQGALLLDNHHHELMGHFMTFWPELLSHCELFRAQRALI